VGTLSKLLSRLLPSTIESPNEQETRPVLFTREKMLAVNRVEGAFYHDDKKIGFMEFKKADVAIRPLTKKDNRVNVYRSSGSFGLCVYYYDDDIQHVFISNGNHFVRINRDEIPALRIALRKFTQNAKPNLKRPVGKPFTEYRPPLQWKSYDS